MGQKLKIALISHTFQIKYYARRWQLFAQEHPDVDVTLITPSVVKWYPKKDYSYGNSKTTTGKEVDEGNFHVRLVKPIFKRSFLSWNIKSVLKDIKPDVFYHVGFHTQISLVQIGMIMRHYFPKSKLILHSMRGPNFDLKVDKSPCPVKEWIMRRVMYVYYSAIWRYVKKHYKAVFCHYPDAVECFRKEGYEGPIYMQTQVGVNSEWFHPDEAARKEIRNKYNLGDAFVFGSASRFSEEKGVDDILEALPKEGNWKYLMMGAGSEKEEQRLKDKIREKGIEDKVIMTGFVDWYEITKYWNAIDCAIHVPRTTAHWVETFSLSAIQPQATKKPVIGNTSGSVPYQIGFENMIVPESDIDALREKISWVLANQDDAQRIGEEMYKRTLNSFSVNHLNEMFYDTLVEDVLQGTFDPAKVDMTKYTPKKGKIYA